MPRTIAAALALAFVLAGCAKDDEPPGTARSADPSPSATAVSPQPTVSATASASGLSPELAGKAEQAAEDYRDYVAAQVDDTIAATEELVAALKTGAPATARLRYGPSRFGWETIEPVAATVPGLADRVDVAEEDAKAGDVNTGVGVTSTASPAPAVWGGWHRIEKALYADKSVRGMPDIGDQLLRDLESLRTAVPRLDITAATMAAAAVAFAAAMDDKLGGEEERYSHTDLVGLKGNLDGATRVFELLEPIVDARDAALADDLDSALVSIEDALSELEDGDSFVAWGGEKVTSKQRSALNKAVTAYAEAVSDLPAAVS